MQINEALGHVGLNEKQARVYTALLQLGRSTAYAVAEKSGLKRPTVYVILDELRLKGLALKIPHSRRQLFVAKSPDDFLRDAQDQLDSVKTILPQLLAMTTLEQKPKTLFFEGPEGVRQLLEYGISELSDSPEKMIRGFFGHMGTSSPKLVALFEPYNDRLKRLGIKVRGIVPQNPNLGPYRAKDKEYGRELRVISSVKYSATISVDIGDTFVRMLAFEDLWGIVVESKEISAAFRQIFDMIWERNTGSN